MPVIPFAATVGTWLGASAATAAAVGGTAIVAGAALGAGAYAIGSSVGSAGKDEGGGGSDSGSASYISPGTAALTGSVSPESVETQAAQRRLARISKYFTSPTGVLNDATVGTTGVF